MDSVQEWFDPIYMNCRPKLIKLAFRELHDTELAEDLTQSTFLTLLMKYEELQHHPNIEGWLVLTLYNKILNEREKAYHSEIGLDQILEPQISGLTEESFMDVLPDGLNSEEKQILYLFYEVGLPHMELAKHIGCSTEACRMRLSRAKTHCKKLLEKPPG